MFYNGLYGDVNGFSSKRDEMLFLNKIDLTYCLVVYFVVARVSGRFEVSFSWQ